MLMAYRCKFLSITLFSGSFESFTISLFLESLTLLSPFSGSFQSLSLNEPNSGSVAPCRVQHWLSNTWSVALFRVCHFLKLFTVFLVFVRIVVFQYVKTGTFNKSSVNLELDNWKLQKCWQTKGNPIVMYIWGHCNIFESSKETD